MGILDSFFQGYGGNRFFDLTNYEATWCSSGLSFYQIRFRRYFPECSKFWKLIHSDWKYSTDVDIGVMNWSENQFWESCTME